MLNLKKAAVAVLALGSSAVFAGTMGPVCTPGSVTVPCERTAWDFGGKALYLQSTGVDFPNVIDTPTGSTFQNFNESWGWGFQLEGSYHFNTGNDLNVNWYHYSRETTNSYLLPDVVAALGVAAPTFLRIEPKWDAVNIEFGQHVDFGEQKNIRFHGGLQWAQVKREVNTSTAGILFTAGETKFNGIGPRVGSDMSFDLGNGFAIYGNGAMALLVGDNDFNATSNLLGFAVNGSKTTVIPELEAKLGVTYTYPMAQGDLTLDAGYMWVDYINSQQFGFNDTRTDFALHGPYIGLKWIGNVV